jgi:hypothetical protein
MPSFCMVLTEYRYNSSGGAPSCALSDIARIILADDWTLGSFMSTFPAGLLLLSLTRPSLPPAIPAQINLYIRFLEQTEARERGHVMGRSRPSDRARRRPRSCHPWSFCKKPLQLYWNQPAVQRLSHKIFHKTPRSLSKLTRSPGRPPSPLGPAVDTKWAFMGRIRPDAFFLFSLQIIIYLILLIFS